MTHYEVLKNASVDEMALAFYALISPFLEDRTTEEKVKAAKDIKAMLLSEVE